MPLIFKPNWVSHNRLPITTIDVQPGNKRFATGGNDTTVRIWNLIPILDESKDVPGVQTLLCTLQHMNSVNIVRWSSDGDYLATGTIDGTIVIWQLKSGQSNGSFGLNTSNVENWGQKMMIQAHSGDVTDLDWSPDCKKLVSSSIDNTVKVWDIETQAQILVLEHMNYVKGVSWDPSGLYIASQSDDKTTVIWDASNGKKVKSIEKPYVESPTSVFFKRPSWSPDGSFLATAGGAKDGKHTSPIVLKPNFAVKDLLGHNGVVVTTRFNPVTYIGDNGKPQFYCALGGRDRMVTIWIANKCSLLTIKNLFTDTVLDMSWASDGSALLCCSNDGTIGICRFLPGELSKKMKRSEVEQFWMSLYGHTNLPKRASQSSTQVVQSKSSKSVSVEKQVEMKLADGKRRITPIHLTKDEEKISNISNLSSDNVGLENGMPVDMQIEEEEENEQDLEKNKKRKRSDSTIESRKKQKKVDVEENKMEQEIEEVEEIEEEGEEEEEIEETQTLHRYSNIVIPYPEKSNRLVKNIKENEYLDVTILKNDHEEESKIVYVLDSKEKWSNRIFDIPVVLNGNDKLSVVGCYSGNLYIFSPNGRRIFPCINLSSTPIAFLDCKDTLVMAVCCDGTLRLWDIDKKKALVQCNISSFIKSSFEKIQTIKIFENKSVYAIMNSGNSYAYDLDLNCWIQVYDINFNCSEFRPSVLGKCTNEIIEKIQLEASEGIPSNIALLNGFSEESKKLRTIAHLEDQIVLSEIFKNSVEFKFWLKKYVTKLSSESQESKLEELCKELLGPTYVPSDIPEGEESKYNWNPKILGMSKRELLVDICKIMISNLSLQSLISKYLNDVNAIKEREKRSTL